MIQVEGLTKKYGEALAVDGISFEIRKGEVVGLLGPNGAGKTTTMKILTCFISATAGRATVNGFDTFLEPEKVKAQIGYLPENCPLYLDMEVDEYLGFMAEIKDVEPKRRKAAVDKVVSDCDLGRVRHKLVGHLSKGYRQRVGLAQALIHDPRILILDEPTSGLDPNQIRDILKLIAGLGQEKTVIHSTHILSEVEATSDRVLIIHNGRIVAQGSPAELMAGSSGIAVYVTLRGPGCEAGLSAAPFVKKVQRLESPREGYEKFLLRGADDRDIAPEVFGLAVERGWTLAELRSEAARLEDVFAKLTRGAA